MGVKASQYSLRQLTKGVVVMNKWIGIGVLAVAVGAGVAWQQGWLNTTSMSAKVNMTDYVPADTVFYAGGTADAKAFEYLRNMDIFRGMQGDLDSMLADMDKGELKDNPTVRFIKYLAVDLFGNMTTYGELVDHYGIDVSKPQAFYMDGVVPVIRISLANQDTFWMAFSSRPKPLLSGNRMPSASRLIFSIATVEPVHP